MNKTLNDIAWEFVFDKHHIFDKLASGKGRTTISAADLNTFREARLMTKIDHQAQLPKIFADNNLSILPISRGTYEIGSFKTFCEFDHEKPSAKAITFPKDLQSIDCNSITSEATAINIAFISLMLHDFTDEEKLRATVNGRMSSSAFSYEIETQQGRTSINVDNSQIEIDGGYEGLKSLILIEAKNYISTDFIIRQIYYPYRLWKQKITKPVRPIFLTYSNGSFHLREYKFERDEFYNSIELIKHKEYFMKIDTIRVDDILTIIQNTPVAQEPDVPFPQADSFNRIINLCELIKGNEPTSKNYITENYDFDPRQTDYYTNAAIYLDLIKKRDNDSSVFVPTSRMERTLSLPISERQLAFASLILSHYVFRATFQSWHANNKMPTKDEVIEIMRKSGLHSVKADETCRRRASTVLSWTKWICGLLE